MNRRRISGSVVLMAGLVCLLVGGRAEADQLYGATGTGAGAGRLYLLNDADGSVILDIGALQDASGNLYGITGMAFNPVTNVLYGSTTRLSPTAPRSLVTINPSNAQVTVIGSFNVLNNTMADITFIGSTLYGWAEGPTEVDDLHTINLTTGLATLVGNSGLSTSGSGLAADGVGNLYLAGDDANGNLTGINPATGLPSSAIDMNGGNESVPALTFHEGLLYGIEHPPSLARLITIDPATGNVVRLGFTVQNLDALASTAAAPEPGTLALAGIGLAGIAVARRRSRRQR